MTRRMTLLALLVLALLPTAPLAAAAGPDDDIPGVPLPSSPVVQSAGGSDVNDVYSVDLAAGDTFTVTLRGPSGSEFDLFFYKPGTLFLSEWQVGEANSPGSAETLTYTAMQAGTHYLYLFAEMGSGTYTLTWTIQHSDPNRRTVWRFYNVSTGVHFYTADAVEKNDVALRLHERYQYEGPAYAINKLNPDNVAPLFRFYNFKKNVHFYTAIPSEKTRVEQELSRTYAYEGVAYNVSLSPTNGTPVYRFYNFKKGVHFYTADPNEKENVLAKLGWTYAYEGVGYYIGN